MNEKWGFVRGSPPYHDTFVSLTVIEEMIVKDHEEFERLEKFLEFFGGDMTKIRTARAIHNPKLSNFFETERKRIDFLHKNFPNRSKKSDWKELEEKEKRELVIQQLYQKISSFKVDGWNDWDQVFFFFFFPYFFIFIKIKIKLISIATRSSSHSWNE